MCACAHTHTLTTRERWEREKVERMNDETYEDDVVVDVDDDDDNNNNNALQFYHTTLWSILVDYIVDSYILCLFLLPLFFLSTYYTISTKWRTTRTTTTTNNIIITTPHGAITIVINWLPKRFICSINMLSDSLSSTWSSLWLTADRKRNEHEFDMKLLFFLRLQIITKGMCIPSI
jgi:hypothetical protein